MSSLTQRHHLLCLVDQALAAGARQDRACRVIGLSARALQRWRLDSDQGDQRPKRLQRPVNRLSELERQRVLALANSQEFGHLPPSQIVPRLADKGQYVACESTFYRVLKAANQLKHRSAQRPAQSRHKPRALCATGPKQLFSWDITYLASPLRGCYFYLYAFMDIFSRKIVGWQVYDNESSELASELLRDLCSQEAIAAHQLVLHSDNGGPMKGATMLATLQALGGAASFSRPAVSNDNPYSESLFKTLKYRPEYPCRPFEDLAAARRWVGAFVRGYNQEHRHSAIRFVTPAQRHAGLDQALLDQRHAVYQAAKAREPRRWSGATRNWTPIPIVHLNPDHASQDVSDPKEFPITLKA